MGLTGRITTVLGLAAAMTLAPLGRADAGDGLAGAYLAARHASALNDVGAAADFFTDALKRDQDNAQLMEQAVLNLLAADRVAEALPVSKRLAKSEPAHRLANLVLAVEDLRSGEFAKVSARIAGTPDGFHPLIGALLEAWAAYGAGDRAAAEAALETLEDRNVFRLFGRYHAGLIRALDGDPEGAVERFAKAASELSSPNNRLALAHGLALEASGKPEEARKVFEEAIATTLTDPQLEAELRRMDAREPPTLAVTTPAEGAAEALFGLAGVLTNEAGRRFALAYARLATYLDPGLTNASLLIAGLLEDEGQYELALSAYEAIPATSVLYQRAQIGRAGALQNLKRDDAAAEVLRAVVAADPKAVSAHVALGDLLRRDEKFDAAAAAYTPAVDLLAKAGRPSWALFYQRGIAYERSAQWDAAEADFNEALAIEPDQPLVLNYLGYSWIEMGRNMEEARKMIARAVEQRPEDGYITDSLGWVYYRTGDYANAVEWLEKAVALAPVDAVINDHLGDALWMVGRKLEAEFQWRRARSFGPEPDALARIKRKLEVGLDAVLSEESSEDAASAAAEAKRNGG